MSFRKPKTPPSTGRHRQPPDRQAPAAFSYHSQRAERPGSGGLKQVSAGNQRPRNLISFWWKRAGFLIGGVVILVCAVNILSLSSSPRIIMLDASNKNAFTHDQAAYQQVATKAFQSSLLNRNKVTVDTATVAATLQKQFPELSSVSVTLPLLGHRPIIYLQTTQPAFIFSAVNGSFVLDATGKALALSATVPTAKLDLPVVTDQTGQRVTLGHAVLTSDNTTFIRTVVADLTAKGVAIGALVLPAGAADELDVHLNGMSYYGKFNMHSDDARQQAGSFLAVQAKLKSENIAPTQYIDVRVAGRAYYQ